MDLLKLIALDEDDLKVLSANLQDAVVRASDLAYVPRAKRFVLMVNRFNWQKALDTSDAVGTAGFERRMAAVRFEKVLKAQCKGLVPGAKGGVLNLLSVVFTPDVAPGGAVVLTFSGGAAIRLTVECIEAEVRDLGSAWEAKSRPEHPED